MSNSTNKFSNTARPPFDHEALDEVLRSVDSEVQAARDLDNQRVSTILAMTALQDAAGRRAANRLTAASGLAVVVRVPGMDWIAPVERALRLIGPFGEVIARGGPPKKSEAAVSDKVADRLAAGHNVAGIGVTPERDLPSVLVTAADLTIEIAPPRNAVIAAVIGLVVGRRPRSMPHDLAQELGFDAIVSCIRRGSTAGACVARLVALGRSGKNSQAPRVDVPALDTLAGYGEAMTWSKSIVGSVQEWRAGLRSWDSIPERGIVLASAPGLGKTSLCASVAAAAGLPFYATSISQLFTGSAGYLGDVVRCLERVIVEATTNGKSVLMIDELDGLPNRATVDNRNRDFWSPIIHQLLLMLDSAISGPASNLIIIGCTNHPEQLDAALVRSGRLNRVITITHPDAQAIEGIFRTHLGGELAAADLAPVALLAVGSTGADVAAWVKAARAVAVTAGRAMRLADLVAQVCPADPRQPEDQLAVARHEAAHCVALSLLEAGRVEAVTIVPRGCQAGRTTSRLPQRDAMSRAQIEDYVVAVLAGRAADTVWGTATTGASGGPGSDLHTATVMVAGVHASWALGETLAYRGAEREALDLMRTDDAFRHTVEYHLQSLHQRAVALVRDNADAILAVADRLLEARVLGGDEVRAIIRAARSTSRSVETPGMAVSVTQGSR